MLAAATILGSGGFVPTGRRETSSLLLLADDGDGAVVVDAGTGLRRLVTDPSLLAGRGRLDVVLTHFHMDHVCGLAYLGGLGEREIVVHGPGPTLQGTSTAAILAGAFAEPVQPGGLAAQIVDYGAGTLAVGGLELQTRRQDGHPGGSMALRAGDVLAWCTDTEADPGTVDFAQGARVLAHEAWIPAPRAGHTAPEDAARLAVQAGARTLVLIHVPPTADETALAVAAAQVHPRVMLAHDGLDLLSL